jgi:hypothetical protein
MFRGFNLKLNWDSKYDDQFFETGKSLFLGYEKSVKETLKNYALSEGVLNGAKMQSNWFPKVDAEIFISHSHKDEKRAIALSGWLYETFGIKTFIDSCIWGYSDDLLKLIDNKFCFQESSKTYNYNLRNYSTSHVHMMLSVALTMMIDNTECVFFLNTPNSISASSIIDKTESPWIYSEIAMTQMVRQKTPRRRLVKEVRHFSKGGVINESLKIQYDLDLSHLAEIDVDTFNIWKRGFVKTNANDALDKLYDLKAVNNNLIKG